MRLPDLRLLRQQSALFHKKWTNAGTAGYVKRTISPVAAGTNNLGVASGVITRNFDAAALKQLRLETSGAAYTSTKAGIISQLDALYGPPGSSTALDGTLNTFTESLQELAANPISAAARSIVNQQRLGPSKSTQTVPQARYRTCAPGLSRSSAPIRIRPARSCQASLN